MSNKYTPGKWEVDPENEEQIYSDKGEGNIVCCAPYGMRRSMEYWPANARLIAASPEMLEMLKNVYYNNDGHIPFAAIAELLNKIEQP